MTEAGKNSALLMQVLVNGKQQSRALSARKSVSHGSRSTSTLHDGIFEFEAASAPVLRKLSTDYLERFPVDSFASLAGSADRPVARLSRVSKSCCLPRQLR